MILVGAGVVTIDNKLVATGRIIVTAIEDGTAGPKFGLHQSMPFGSAVIVAILHRGVGAVAELYHRIACILGVGAAAIGRVHHLHGLAAVAHQPCHSIGLGGVVVRSAVVVEHVVPVQCGARQSGNVKLGSFGSGVGGQRGQFAGVFPVIHDLSHRCGHTARHAV